MSDELKRSPHAAVWNAVRAELEVSEPLAADMALRLERATGHLVELQIRALAGEDVSSLRAAVEASIANIRSVGAAHAVEIMRNTLRTSVETALGAAIAALH